MSVYGTPGSATYAVGIPSIEGMLDVLPDNTSNLISAPNVRDVVAGLWDSIQGLSASIALSNTLFYNNPDPSSSGVGGIPVGTSFNNQSILSILDDMFYPYVAPILSISANPSQLEFGDSSTNISLNWSIQAKKNNVISSVITMPNNSSNQVNVATPTSNTLSTGVLSNAVPTLNNTTTFTLTVSDFNSSNNTGIPNNTATTQVVWRLKRYWGVSSTFVALTSTQIINLSGAGVGTGNELSTTRVQTRNGINGGGQYLVFAWPSAWGEPSFVINGLPNTAFTKVNNNFTVANSYGYTASYNVYMSNTVQNSPITSFQIN